MDDPRIRLLNRLYARKRKELKERDKLKVIVALLLVYYHPLYSIFQRAVLLLNCATVVLHEFAH
jgi:hypothetical protein